MRVSSYRCIAMDPPWYEHGGIKKGAQRHYKILKLPQIIETVLGSQYWRPDGSGCHLWCWYTDNHLRDALGLIDALGFRYIRTLIWIKAAPCRVQLDAELSCGVEGWRTQGFGIGQYLRGQHEGCILAVRGAAHRMVRNRDVGSVVVAPRGRHSQKPQAAYDAIERVSPGPRLEMFARALRDGWDTWGDEAPEAKETGEAG